jgi:class 3 adenylate cyclase
VAFNVPAAPIQTRRQRFNAGQMDGTMGEVSGSSSCPLHHDALIGREVERHRGRLIHTIGDGALATFDGPARAIRCADAIAGGIRAIGIEIRSGLHAGEVENRGDDVGGIGVHIAARVMAAADPGEVLVSSTVKDPVAGFWAGADAAPSSASPTSSRGCTLRVGGP